MCSSDLGFEKNQNSKPGQLEVVVKRDQKQINVRVKDSANNLPPQFELESSSNLGMQIVSNLIKNELNGVLKIFSADGHTIAEINFPAS